MKDSSDILTDAIVQWGQIEWRPIEEADKEETILAGWGRGAELIESYWCDWHKQWMSSSFDAAFFPTHFAVLANQPTPTE